MLKMVKYSVLILVCLVSAFGTATGTPVKLKLDESNVNEGIDQLNFDGERFLRNAATYQYDLSAIVGHVLYPGKVKGTCPDQRESYDSFSLSVDSYLKDDVRPEVKSSNQVLYDAKTTIGQEGGLRLFAFSGQVSKKRAAEVLVTDVAWLGISGNELVDDWREQAMSRLAEDDCSPVLILGAKSRVATYKYFRSTEKSKGLTGSVFGFDGRVYAEDSQTTTETLLVIDPIPVRVRITPKSGVVLSEFVDPKSLPHVIAVPDGGFEDHP